MSERRTRLRIPPLAVLAAGACIALAAWPAFLNARDGARVDPIVALTPAPVKADWRVRDADIAFLESRFGKIDNDSIIPRMLSAAYLQRYRERGDIGDVLRSERAARQSLRALPRGNPSGDLALAGALLTLHDFRGALRAVDDARYWLRDDDGVAAEAAGLDLEIGDLRDAQRLIAAHAQSPAFETVSARLDEETGRLDEARRMLDRATHRADAIYDTPAERRAWFHAREAELAYEAGDHAVARAEAHVALDDFANHLRALTILARVDLADGNCSAAADSATRAANVQPNPEVLGMLADAQAACGNAAAAAATRDEIFAVERITASQRVNDRLIAVYEADHSVHLDDAYAIARRELATRDDIYTEDTLAWAASQDGKPAVARAAIVRALATGLRDARVFYHAGVIAERDGRTADARGYYASALALDPAFGRPAADRARASLAQLR